MKHVLLGMGLRSKNGDDEGPALTSGRRPEWEFTLRAPRIPAGHTLDVSIETSSTGEWDGEEATLVSFTQVTDVDDPFEETKSNVGANNDFEFVSYRDIFIRAVWTIDGGTEEFPFEVEAASKWLDVSIDSSDLDLLRSRVQKQSNLAERLTEAELALQAHITELIDGLDGITSSVHHDMVRTAIASQMNFEFETQEIETAARGGDESARVTLRSRGDISPTAVKLLSISEEVSVATTLPGIP